MLYPGKDIKTLGPSTDTEKLLKGIMGALKHYDPFRKRSMLLINSFSSSLKISKNQSLDRRGHYVKIMAWNSEGVGRSKVEIFA